MAIEIGNAELVGVPHHPLDKPIPRFKESYEVALDVPLRPMLGPENRLHRSRMAN